MEILQGRVEQVACKPCGLGVLSKMQIWEADQALRKAFGHKHCMVPAEFKDECSGKIIRAHTVSKSANLKRIAKEGHVYSFVPSIADLEKTQGVIEPKLYGINKASTFTGFCSYHDTRVFLPVENGPFEETEEQCFLLAYRTLVMELFKKEVSLSRVLPFTKKAIRQRPKEVQDQVRTYMHYHEVGLKAAVRDGEHYKQIYDDILVNGRFENIKYMLYYFEKVPSVMTSTGFFPEFDFNGNPLQDLVNVVDIPDMIVVTSFALDNGGAVMFAWVEGPSYKGNCHKFVNSMRPIPGSSLTSNIVRMFFEHCENIHLNPDWWDALGDEEKEDLLTRNSKSGMLELRGNDCLVDDGTFFDDWGLTWTSPNY